MNATRNLSAGILITLPIMAHSEIVHERPLLPIQPSAVLEQGEYELIPLERQTTTPIHQPSTVSSNHHQDDAINQAIIKQDFKTLEQLLAQTPQTNHDPLLRLDAQAALALHQRQYPKAIKAYQTILQQSPDSHGVRFDLAASLFMDKRYREAEHAFKQIKQDTHQESVWQKKADQYLNVIQQAETWQPEISANYVQTDNVNNATENETFQINDWVFRKRDEDKPQSAQGIAYQLGVGRERNVGGHHFLGAGLNTGGVHYFNHPEFSEQYAQIDLHYRHKTAKQQIGFNPFMNQHWIGGSRYQHRFGVKTDYSRQLGKTWSGYLSAQHEQIRYQDPIYKQYYNGFANMAMARIQKNFSHHTTLFAGVQTEKVRRKLRSESASAHGGHIGLRYNHKLWGTRLYVRYNHRTFDDVHDVFALHRKDHEWRASASIHHKKISWKGITPELNYAYDKYDSNINLYDRKTGQVFLSLTKQW